MSRQSAAHMLAHYLSSAFRGANLHWDSDNHAEVEAIISDLLDTALGEFDAYARGLAIAAAAKEPTHQALVDAGLLPSSRAVDAAVVANGTPFAGLEDE